MKKLIILFMAILLLAGCKPKEEIVVPEYPYEIQSTVVDMSEYEGVKSTNHNFRLIRVGELFSCIDQGSSGIFYLGRTNCACCQKVVRYLNETAQELGVTVYYIDVYNKDEPLSDETLQNQLREYMYEILGTDDEGEKVLLTPQVFSVVNGKFYDTLICFDGMTMDPNPTEEQISKLKDVYRRIMKPFAK